VASSLRVDDVTVSFGGNKVLHGVSLKASKGKVTGLIGPNGAGKSTLFDVVSGLRRPDAGRVFLGRRNVTHLGPAPRSRHGLARTFQRLELFGRLSVRDNLRVAAELGPDRRHARAVVRSLLDRLDLRDVADAPADALPTGVGRLVEVGRAMAVKPRVLLLDEPAAGQNAQETERFAGLLRSLAADGTAVVLVEHDVGLVMDVCDRIYVLDLGHIICDGPPETVRTDEAVLSAYLGQL
jgi:branched-chain amino acid transport system ATP-binding protein